MRGGAVWGAQQSDPSEIPVFLNGVARGCFRGDLVYSLTTNEISGVFVLKNAGEQEQRLLHTNDFRVAEVGCGEHGIACAFNRKNGTSSIAVMKANGEELHEITEGDTIDLCPSWVPGETSTLVYQSAGVARTETGVATGRGPFKIEKVDYESGTVETIAEDEKSDLLNPHCAEDGSIYFIRRPYTAPNVKLSPWRSVLELAVLPFRLLFAVFQFLNFFSARYSGKFLTSAGGAQQREADLQHMAIWGNVVSATKDAKTKGDGEEGLVPKQWELVRRLGGSEEVLGRGVLSFDLGSDGLLVYTNGRTVFALDNKGVKRTLAEGKMIRQVTAL